MENLLSEEEKETLQPILKEELKKARINVNSVRWQLQKDIHADWELWNETLQHETNLENIAKKLWPDNWQEVIPLREPVG